MNCPGRGRTSIERRGPKAYLPGATASLGARASAAAELEKQLREAGLAATKVDDPELARFRDLAAYLAAPPTTPVTAAQLAAFTTTLEELS